jgi:hypothetical protein
MNLDKTENLGVARLDTRVGWLRASLGAANHKHSVFQLLANPDP